MRMIIEGTLYDTDTAEPIGKGHEICDDRCPREGKIDLLDESEDLEGLFELSPYRLKRGQVDLLSIKGKLPFEEGGCDAYRVWVCEELFRKANGGFFLAARCNMAFAARREGKDIYVSEHLGILPLAEEDAMDWVERFLDVEDYEALFGPVAE